MLEMHIWQNVLGLSAAWVMPRAPKDADNEAVKCRINAMYLPEPDNLRTAVRVRLVLCASLPIVDVNLLHSTQHQL